MGELAIMFMIIVVVSIVCCLVLLIKNDKHKINNFKIYLISIYGLILGWMIYTTGPSNDLIGKLMGIIFIIFSIIGLTVKNKNMRMCKLVLLISILGSTVTLLFL